MRWYEKILPQILTEITGAPRSKVEIRWSETSWTHNIFRVWELLFWRRVGIRQELSASILGQQPHTFEALCGITEGIIRSFLSTFHLPSLKLVYVPALATPQGVFFPSIYCFSIAFDAGANNTPPTTFTWTHTCTGSNLILFMGGYGPGDITAATYNSVSLSQTRAAVSHDSGFGALWHLAGPSTGANTASVTAGASGSYWTLSYTGASQTGIPDASNTASVTGSTSLAVTVTTIADKCFVVGSTGDSNGAGTSSAGANTTSRSVGNNAARGMDSGSAKTPAGGVTLNVSDTSGAANLYWIAASFAPATAAAGATRSILFNLLGVGS